MKTAFTQSQMRRLASIFDGFVQVILGSFIVQGVFSSNGTDPIVMGIGILCLMFSFWLSLRLERIGDRLIINSHFKHEHRTI